MLGAEGTIDVAVLAGQLNVSAASIRRDLELLEEQRLLRRTHGGAVAQSITYELPLRYRSGQREDQKRAIARTAAACVSQGRTTVGLTGGTTTTEVARCLLDHTDLTVVTNAINIASELVVRQNVRLVMTGGVARSQSYELVGPLAEASLAGLYVDVAFLGFDGASPDAGFTTHHEQEAHTDKALLNRATKVVAVGDSTKLGKVTFAQICRFEDVDELITDANADPDVVAGLEAAGLRVSLAGSPSDP